MPPPGEDQRRARQRIALLLGATSSIGGFFLNLYADWVRSEFELVARSSVTVQLFLLVFVMAASSGLTFLVSRQFIRKGRSVQIVQDELLIQANAVIHSVPDDEAVAGRSLKYLERHMPTTDLVLFIHGLGLDADDFRPYMAESEYHTAALTLFGFNSTERNDERYRPVGLNTHLELVNYFINELHTRYPKKRITLAGFSFGADLLMFLAERLVRESNRRYRPHAILLLDPNVNRSTMNISTAISMMDTEHPLNELRRVVNSASNLVEFQNLCEYLYKITHKDLIQIKRHATDVLSRWPASSYETFIDRVCDIVDVTRKVELIFSFHYEQPFNAALRAARARGLATTLFDSTRYDHFELIAVEFLRKKISELLSSGR
jgi:predicted alpha/beta-fold hydrolase